MGGDISVEKGLEQNRGAHWRWSLCEHAMGSAVAEDEAEGGGGVDLKGAVGGHTKSYLWFLTGLDNRKKSYFILAASAIC